MINLPFADRPQAGHLLGRHLACLNLGLAENAIVLGLARGGVPVAAEVADELHLPLDVVVVRKLGVPHNSEFAMGAVAGGRVQVLDEELIAQLAIPAAGVEQITARAVEEAILRERYYRTECSAPDLHGWTVVLVDDGLATGSSMLAAVRYVNSFRPTKVIAVAPVGTEEACSRLKTLTDDCICLAIPDEFRAVGQWYRNFTQVSDDDVRQVLQQHLQRFSPQVTTRRQLAP